jgi:hypothetical protein
MRLGLELVRNSWRLTFDAPGELTNRKKGYTRVREETRTCNSLQIKKKEWCRRGESNPRPRDYETLALPLSYAGMTQIFMLRIRLRTCQGSVPGGWTTPTLAPLTNNPIHLKHTDWNE